MWIMIYKKPFFPLVNARIRNTDWNYMTIHYSSFYYVSLRSCSEILDVSDHNSRHESSDCRAIRAPYVVILFIRSSRGAQNRTPGFRFNEFFLIQGIYTAWEKNRGLIWGRKFERLKWCGWYYVKIEKHALDIDESDRPTRVWSFSTFIGSMKYQYQYRQCVYDFAESISAIL